MFLSDSLFCFLPCRLSLSLIITRKFHIAIVGKNPPYQETGYVSKLIGIHMHGGITSLLLYLWHSTIAPHTFICLNEFKQEQSYRITCVVQCNFNFIVSVFASPSLFSLFSYVFSAVRREHQLLC